MKKAIATLLLVALPLICQADNYGPNYSHSKALVIGINKYLLWPHLEYAVRDARDVSALLKQKNFRVKLLLNAEATRQNILTEIDRLLQNADRNSRIFLYFAGHGQTEDQPGGKEKGYIVPVDADLYDWQRTMLPMKEINRRVKESRAKHIFLAFDSCYSGLGLTRGFKIIKNQGDSYIDKMMRLRSIQILTAGGRSEQAIEADGHGLFTQHLLAALAGSADVDADGYTTGTEIYATLRPSITRHSFNRQTPQFGYIDGEGDIVFKVRKKIAKPAAITITTIVPDITIWVNGTRREARLEKGTHKLNTLSGPNELLVKRGSRTLFSKTMTLAPGENYRVNIQTDRHASSKRQPFSMFSIANRKIKNFSNAIASDLDGDGAEEIVTPSGNTLYVLKTDGSVLWEKTFAHGIGLNLVAPYNGAPAIAVSGRADATLYFKLLDRSGAVIWSQTRQIRRSYRGKPDGSGRIVKLADLDRDGREEIITFSSAGYAWKPRGLIVYDQSGRERWRYLTGPSPTNIVIWKNGRQKPDIVIGTYSPGNGNREGHNLTDDQHAYVISIDANGKTNWVNQVGTYYTGAKVMLADRDNNGTEELYAYKWVAYDYRNDEGAVYQFGRNGRIKSQLQLRNSIKSAAFSHRRNRSGLMYAADKNGVIYQLDQRLRITNKKALNTAAIPLMINLVGVHDYDGDKHEDVLLYSFNRLQKGKNPRSDYGPRNKVFYTNMQYQILSKDMSRVIKQVSIAEEWDKWRGFRLKDLDRPEMPQYPFMALSDKVTLFNF